MNKNDLWKQVLSDIETKSIVTPIAFNQFIKPNSIFDIQENPSIIYLSSNTNAFIIRIIKERYIHVMEEGFKNVTGKDYRVIVKHRDEYKEKHKVISADNRSVAFVPDFSGEFSKEKIFNPKYTFDNFVVGECNKLAYSACLAIAQDATDAFNPLFIYGKSGLGKTHLMNAIGIYMLTYHSDMRILYVSSETFTNDFIKALQNGKISEFKAKYRKADVLLIDDIQFLEGKEETQGEFFHTFNTLYEEKKLIIISSDRPPNKLSKLDERLRSRFQWNLITDIQPPDYETRVAILLKNAENMDIKVNDEVYNIICMIAEKIKDNIRELEGAFSRLVTFSKMMGQPLDLSFAKTTLKDIFIAGDDITPEKIKSSVAKYYKIKLSDLDSETRKNSIAYPRQIAMYLCRSMTDLSLPKIGKLFGDKHYSTVKHGCDKIEDELKTDAHLKEEIDKIKDIISG